MPLNPPTWKGPDVYYSTNVFVNKVPVALWQPPAGAFNDGKPGTRIIAGARMYANNESGTQAMIRDTIAEQGVDGAKDDTGGSPPAAADAPKRGDSKETSSMQAQPGEVELKIEDLPGSFSANLNDPIYKKRISRYFTLGTVNRPIVQPAPISPKDIATNWINLCVNLLDPARSQFTFRISSGYRDLAYNRKIGSSDRSDHAYGKAADLTCGSDAANKKLFIWFINSGLPFRQIIWEKARTSWVHIAYDGGRKLNEPRRVMGTRTGRAPFTNLGVNGERAESWVNSF
jgi:hypothetical protein